MQVYSFVVLQGKVLAEMFLLGMAMGLLYDLLRIFRRLFRVSRLFVQVTDFCYWPLVILLLWEMQNETVYGVVRFCQLFFVALGMLFYYSMISRWVIFAVYTPIHFIAKQIAKIYRYIERRADLLLQKAEGRLNSVKRKKLAGRKEKHEKKSNEPAEKKEAG